MSSVPPAKHLYVRFGADHTTLERSERGIELQLPLPLLKGSDLEIHEVTGGEIEEIEGGFILRGPQSLTGVLVRATDALGLEEDAKWIYQRVLAACGGFALYRAWNYVPQINAIYDGLENYHRFNLGRALAYGENFGPEMEPRLPAASAVGIHDGTLVTIFTAGSDRVKYVENPEQLPAYSYPKEYGPKSPSFSRGAVRDRAAGPQAYLSGTASIKGHATIGSGDVGLQCEVTCDNIRLVFTSMGLPDPLADVSEHYQSKIYLRNVEDLDAVRAALHKCGAGSLADASAVVQADICRPDLDVEIELTGV